MGFSILVRAIVPQMDEDDPNWMDNYKARLMEVSDLDLMEALDRLEVLAPQVLSEQWYGRLSDALDAHLKPLIEPTKH